MRAKHRDCDATWTLGVASEQSKGTSVFAAAKLSSSQKLAVDRRIEIWGVEVKAMLLTDALHQNAIVVR